MTTTYDMTRCNLVVAGQLISGFGEGAVLTVSQDNPSWTPRVGATGEVSRARNNNRMGKFVFRLMQTSASNAYLEGLRQADESNRTTIGAVRLTSLDDSTDIGGDECWLEKMPDIQRGAEVSEVEWSVVVPRMQGGPGSPAVFSP